VKKPKFQTPTGMHDILAEEQKYFQKIYEVVEDIANFYNFKKIETPIVEESELFEEGTGFSTDIVQKEMFSFRTKGGDHLVLRPEGTPSIARAYIQHGMQNLPQPVKLWYFGPYFRYEKPQAGRYRQFWQFGLEILGEASSAIDAQIILIFYNILKELKFKNLVIEVNSIGDSQCRPYYKKLLVGYLKSKADALCSDCRRRLKENPLRILDCKEEKCQRVVFQAPQILDHLCENCHKHFKEVLEFLDELGLSYHLNPYLVRGLDYYTRTVFEIREDIEKGKAVGSLCGGGRYDNLVKILGGRYTPAMGAAGGADRIMDLLKGKTVRLPKEKEPQVFLAQLGNLAKRKSLKLLEDFRQERIFVAESLGRDSLKAQLRMAEKTGVRYTLILGQREALEGTILIKDMEKGTQLIVKSEKVVKEIKKRLKK